MTMISLAQMRTALKAVLDTVTGLDGSTTLTVFTYMPAAIPDEDCPAAILVPGVAVYNQEEEGGKIVIVTRDWVIRFVAQKEGIGNATDPEVMFDTMLTPIIEKLASYQRVPVVEEPDLRRDFEMYLTGGGDQGIGSVPIGGHTFAATDIEFSTQIEEIITPAWR
jgi:hypothetical protein